MKKPQTEEESGNLKVGQTFNKWKDTKPLVEDKYEYQKKAANLNVKIEIEQEATLDEIKSQNTKKPATNKKRRRSSSSTDDKDCKQESKKKPKKESTIEIKKEDVKIDKKIVGDQEDTKQKQKTSAKQKALMGEVVFVLSGFQNPERANLRDQAVKMGAKYKSDWDDSCTHLV
jgi:DNA-repair protein XRCC1